MRPQVTVGEAPQRGQRTAWQARHQALAQVGHGSWLSGSVRCSFSPQIDLPAFQTDHNSWVGSLPARSRS